MLTLRNIIDTVSGLRFVVEKLDLKSGLGKRYLLAQELLCEDELLISEIANVTEVIGALDHSVDVIEHICIKLEQIRDIHGTIKNLSSAATLDDIEFFEIKNFGLLASEIQELLSNIKINAVSIPDLNGVIEILDPESQRLPQFYINSLYSAELACLRIKHKALKDQNQGLAEEVRLKCIEIEDTIRQDLSLQLFEYVDRLTLALNNIAYLDVLIAKAKQARSMNFSKPEITSKDTDYKGLFNPQIKEILQKSSKDFQAIDITLHQSPCLITGANMAGKTVLLKTIALSQYLFQFGFYVPAASAAIVPVDMVMLSINDDQSELSGLSSYAAEMLNVNAILKAIKSKKRVLALIDELARTTNPDEGKAIVDAAIEILESKNVRSLITTHYSGLQTKCRKLRVKGLRTDNLDERITIENINNFMDYSLEENLDETKSHEALAIAKVLGIDEELLEKAKRFMKK